MANKNIKTAFAILAFILLSIILIGLVWLASGEYPVGLVLAYTAGLSMIFLPCTLPLVFIIIPLTIGHKPWKGLTMALLFGLGISITLAIYGIITAEIGSFLGVDKVTRIMFTIAGLAALIFGLSELHLIKVSLPERAMPQWINKKKDYTKSFLLGLLLGNAGVGCPNPAFYVLLIYIASVGSLTAGGWLGFIHGLGRATPLIFLAVLGIMGINSVKWVATKKDYIDKITGWLLVIFGAFIFSFGFFGMAWWEEGFIHKSWNAILSNIAPNLAEKAGHELLVPAGFVSGPLWSGWVFILVTILIVYLWHRHKIKKIERRL